MSALTSAHRIYTQQPVKHLWGFFFVFFLIIIIIFNTKPPFFQPTGGKVDEADRYFMLTTLGEAQQPVCYWQSYLFK